MMSCWKIVGLGLLVGGLAASCTVSSGDDDDNGAGGSPTTYTGGTGGTAGGGGAGGVTETGGTAGTSPTAATDDACFNCLAQVCPDYGTCLANAECEPQLSQFRQCTYERQHAVPAEEYGQAQQDECLAVIDQGDPNNLAVGVHDTIGCADNEGLDCQTTCFIFI